MMQTTLSLEGVPKEPAKSPTGFYLQPAQKGLLLIIVLGILYLRIWRRKKEHVQYCSHCGKKNPAHLTNCQKCAAPLLKLSK